MPMPYDATRSALLRPESRQTLFWAGITPTPPQLCAEAARLAYCRAEREAAELQRLTAALQLVGYGAPRLFADADSGAFAFGARRAADGAALVAFRGTQVDDPSDLATDANALPVPWRHGPGRVHQGFAAAYEALHPQIEAWLKGEAAARRFLLLCGHSLGGALATLAAAVWRPAFIVTLGAPRVGDASFGPSLAGLEGVRAVNCCDVVPRLLPAGLGYAHHAPAHYIDAQGKLHRNPGRELIEADRERGRRHYLDQFAWRRGTLPLRDLADHAPVNYARAFFP